MIDATTHKQLQDLFRRENRSLLQYLSEAIPWAAEKDRFLVDKICALASEERDGLKRFAQWMDQQKVLLPYLGAYPSVYTNYNFLSIRTMLKMLIEEQRKDVAELEHYSSLTEDLPVREHLSQLASLNRSQLQELEAMVSAPAP